MCVTTHSLEKSPPITAVQSVLGTTEEWLVAVSNERGGPHSFHVHTNYFAIVAHGDWDYQKGVLTYNETKPFGGWVAG